MIQTWIGDITPLLNERIYRKYYDSLPKWRKEKADKLKNLKKAQSAGVWIVYQKMQEAYGFAEDAVYTLSQSGKYAMCAVDVGNEGAREAERRLKVDGCTGIHEE